MYVLNEGHNMHLRGSIIESNLLCVKEADLWPDFGEILLDILVAGVSALTCGN